MRSESTHLRRYGATLYTGTMKESFTAILCIILEIIFCALIHIYLFFLYLLSNDCHKDLGHIIEAIINDHTIPKYRFSAL